MDKSKACMSSIGMFAAIPCTFCKKHWINHVLLFIKVRHFLKNMDGFVHKICRQADNARTPPTTISIHVCFGQIEHLVSRQCVLAYCSLHRWFTCVVQYIINSLAVGYSLHCPLYKSVAGVMMIILHF